MLETPFPFFVSKKLGEIPIFGTFLAKKSILAYISLKINIFIHWPIFMILEKETLPYTMEKGDPTLYYDTKQIYFGCINFKFTGGW